MVFIPINAAQPWLDFREMAVSVPPAHIPTEKVGTWWVSRGV